MCVFRLRVRVCVCVHRVRVWMGRRSRVCVCVLADGGLAALGLSRAAVLLVNLTSQTNRSPGAWIIFTAVFIIAPRATLFKRVCTGTPACVSACARGRVGMCVCVCVCLCQVGGANSKHCVKRS